MIGVWGVGCGVWGVGCGVWGVGCGVWLGGIAEDRRGGARLGLLGFYLSECSASARAQEGALGRLGPVESRNNGASHDPVLVLLR
jgi:hypothetical protein